MKSLEANKLLQVVSFSNHPTSRNQFENRNPNLAFLAVIVSGTKSNFQLVDMSFHDAYQSRICSCQEFGPANTNNFEDDNDSVMRLPLHRENELKEMLTFFPHDMRPEFDKWIRIVVKEAIEWSHKNQATNSMHGYPDVNLRSLELRISNIISPLLTGDHIKDIGGMPVEITLIDSHTKEKVKLGDEASGKVEIVVIEAEVDDGRNEFEGILVQHKEGNKSVRVDRLCLNLVEGTALLPTVSIARNKRWMKISKVRLQARFVDDFNNIQVKEAQTEPFCIKDRRNEAYKKHPIPALDDDVWRLDNIDRKGLLARSLREAKIKTVGDFIDRLFLLPHCLEKIFDDAKHAKSLKHTVKHARKCPAKFKYCSSLESFDQETVVVFNVSGEVMGLYLDDQFLSGDILSDPQKNVAKKLVISAFKNWGDVIHINTDPLVSRCSPHIPNHCIVSDPVGHGFIKTETGTPFDKIIFPDMLDLDSNERFLGSNMLADELDPNPRFLPEPLRTRYNEIYRGFESICTSNQHQPEPAFGFFGTKAAQKNMFCKRWKMLVCIVTFKIRSKQKRSLGGIHAQKKPRLSQ